MAFSRSECVSITISRQSWSARSRSAELTKGDWSAAGRVLEMMRTGDGVRVDPLEESHNISRSSDA